MATAHIALKASSRAKAGKGAARAIRREGNIPAVIYGDNKEPVLISLAEKELTKALHKEHIFTKLCDLDVDGKKHLVLARDIQLDPVSDRVKHADFMRVSEKTKIRVMVPVTFSNQKDAIGLSKGGVLNIVKHEIEMLCNANNIPESLVVNLKGLDIGHSLHISQVTLPAGVTVLHMEEDFTVVTIISPSALKSAEEEVAEAAAATAAAAAAAATPAAGAAPAAGGAAGKGGDAKAAAPAKGGDAKAAAPAAKGKK